MKRRFKIKFPLLLLGLALALSVSLFDGFVIAQPPCDWDCQTTDCCSPGYELMCNGGTYGGVCPNACVGAGAYTMPIGQCPY